MPGLKLLSMKLPKGNQPKPETDRCYRSALSHCLERETNGAESECSPSKSVKFNKQRPKSGQQYEPFPERETIGQESGKKGQEFVEAVPSRPQLDSLFEDELQEEEQDTNIYSSKKLKMLRLNSEQPTPQTVNELGRQACNFQF